MPLIQVAKDDLIRLRGMVYEKHWSITQLPIMRAPVSDGTRKACVREIRTLEKFYRRLTLAIRKTHGHDCCPLLVEFADAPPPP